MLKAALIGVGHWGPNIIKSIELTELGFVKWICDKNRERLELIGQRNAKAQLTEDYQEVLQDQEVDCVFIATPVKSHFALAHAALEAGKHVFIEKPITQTSEQAKILTALAEKQNKKLMVGHIFDFNAGIDVLKEKIDNHELGDIQYINIERTNLGPVRTDVNALWDLATHDITILMKLLKKDPISVSVFGKSYLNQGIDDVNFIHFEFPGNVLAHVHASWLNPRKVRQATVVGSKRMAVWDDLDIKQPVKIYDKHVEATSNQDVILDTFINFKTACVDGGMTVPTVNQVAPLEAECKHFLKSILENKTPSSDGHAGFQVVRILEKATESLLNNGKVVYF